MPKPEAKIGLGSAFVISIWRPARFVSGTVAAAIDGNLIGVMETIQAAPKAICDRGFGLIKMTEVDNPKRVTKLATTVPRRLGTGDILGPAVFFLASNEASFITGQTIHMIGYGVTT